MVSCFLICRVIKVLLDHLDHLDLLGIMVHQDPVVKMERLEQLDML